MGYTTIIPPILFDRKFSHLSFLIFTRFSISSSPHSACFLPLLLPSINVPFIVAKTSSTLIFSHYFDILHSLREYIGFTNFAVSSITTFLISNFLRMLNCLLFNSIFHFIFLQLLPQNRTPLTPHCQH